MHQAHEVTIDCAERYVLVKCGDDVDMYDEIPDYCPRCGEPL